MLERSRYLYRTNVSTFRQFLIERAHHGAGELRGNIRHFRFRRRGFTRQISADPRPRNGAWLARGCASSLDTLEAIFGYGSSSLTEARTAFRRWRQQSPAAIFTAFDWLVRAKTSWATAGVAAAFGLVSAMLSTASCWAPPRGSHPAGLPVVAQ